MLFLALIFFLSFQFIESVNSPKVPRILGYSQKLAQEFKSAGNADPYKTYPLAADQYALLYGIFSQEIGKNKDLNDEIKIPGKITYPNNPSKSVMIRILINSDQICFHRELKETDPLIINLDPSLKDYQEAFQEVEFPSPGNHSHYTEEICAIEFDGKQVKVPCKVNDSSVIFPADKKNRNMQLVLYKPKPSKVLPQANQ